MFRLCLSVFAALLAAALAYSVHGYQPRQTHVYHYNGGYGTHKQNSRNYESQRVHNHYYYGHASNQYGGSGSPYGKDAKSKDRETYHFQVGDDFGPYEFISPKNGSLLGFNIDILNAVCKQAHKRCFYIQDSYENCWRTEGNVQSPGRGLLDGWYVGCLGVQPTQRRLNSFNFTTPYAKKAPAAIYHRAGEKADNATDLKGKKIGFVSGWAASADCLARQSGLTNNHGVQYTTVTFADHLLLVAALKNKQVDLIVTFEDAVKLDKDLSAIGPELNCTKGGISVLTHYGSKLLDWWNPAFEQLQKNGQYSKLCKEKKEEYAPRGEIHCL